MRVARCMHATPPCSSCPCNWSACRLAPPFSGGPLPAGKWQEELDEEVELEEKRLAYVGATRAKDRLYFLTTQVAGRRG